MKGPEAKAKEKCRTIGFASVPFIASSLIILSQVPASAKVLHAQAHFPADSNTVSVLVSVLFTESKSESE